MNPMEEIEIKFERMVPLGGPPFSEVLAAVRESFAGVEPSNFSMPPQILEMADQMADYLPAMKLMQLSLLYLLTGNKLPDKKTVDYLHHLILDLVDQELELDCNEPPHILANRLAELMLSCLKFILINMPEETRPKLQDALGQALQDRLSKMTV